MPSAATVSVLRVGRNEVTCFWSPPPSAPRRRWGGFRHYSAAPQRWQTPTRPGRRPMTDSAQMGVPRGRISAESQARNRRSVSAPSATGAAAELGAVDRVAECRSGDQMDQKLAVLARHDRTGQCRGDPAGMQVVGDVAPDHHGAALAAIWFDGGEPTPGAARALRETRQTPGRAAPRSRCRVRSSRRRACRAVRRPLRGSVPAPGRPGCRNGAESADARPRRRRCRAAATLRARCGRSPPAPCRGSAVGPHPTCGGPA